MEDWHKVPPRPEQRRLVGVEIVEVALNCAYGRRGTNRYITNKNDTNTVRKSCNAVQPF